MFENGLGVQKTLFLFLADVRGQLVAYFGEIVEGDESFISVVLSLSAI